MNYEEILSEAIEEAVGFLKLLPMRPVDLIDIMTSYGALSSMVVCRDLMDWMKKSVCAPFHIKEIALLIHNGICACEAVTWLRNPPKENQVVFNIAIERLRNSVKSSRLAFSALDMVNRIRELRGVIYVCCHKLGYTRQEWDAAIERASKTLRFAGFEPEEELTAPMGPE